MTYDDIKNDKWVCMASSTECKCQHGKHVLEDGRIKKDSSDRGILMCLWQLVMMFFFRWKWPSIDHVVPLAYKFGGCGQQCVTNMQLLCTKCNIRKVKCVLFGAHRC